MPRLLGDRWCAGIGSGVVSHGTVSGTGTVIASRAGDAHWYKGDVIYQREDEKSAFIECAEKRIDELGANRLRAGGASWAAWLAGRGYRDSFGRVEASWNVADVGPDGTIAVVLDRATGRGLMLLSPDGSVLGVPHAMPDDQTVQVVAAGQAVWTENARRNIQTVGLPAFAFLTERGFWLRIVRRGDVWWMLYQDEKDRLLFHESGKPVGYLVAQGNTFRPDVTSQPRVVYARNEGERPEDIVVVTEFGKMIDLRPGVIAKPDPDPDPTLPPPDKESKMENQYEFVSNHPMKSVLGFPKDGRDANGNVVKDNRMARAYNSFRFLCAVVRSLNAQAGVAPVRWGIQKKPQGDFLPVVEKQGYWGDGIRTRTEGNDIIGSREDEGAKPAWGTPGDASQNSDAEGFALPPSDAEIVAEMRSRGYEVAGDVEEPKPDPGPDPDPKPDPVPDPIKDDVAKELRKRIESIAATVEASDIRSHAALTKSHDTLSEVGRLKTRVEQLEKDDPGNTNLPNPIGGDMVDRIADAVVDRIAARVKKLTDNLK